MDGRIQVRATITLPKLAVGRVVWVDPEDPYIAAAIKSGHVVPVDEAAIPDDPSGVVIDDNVDALPDIPVDETDVPDELESDDVAVVDGDDDDEADE